MDSNTSNAWSKLHNMSNKTLLKIFMDKVSINNYKEKCEELNREIAIYKEQSERYTKVNEALQKQVSALKIAHENQIKNLPSKSNTFKCLKQCLAHAQERYKEREVYLQEIERDMKQKYDRLVEESDAVWPESQQLKQEKLNLSKLELDLKIGFRAIEEEREKIKLKKSINQELFNGAIVEFVKAVKEKKENMEVIAEIERYTRQGNLLLKEYEKAMMNAAKRRRNEEFLHCNTMYKDKKDDLPQIQNKGRASPTPSTSSILNSSISKINYDSTASEKYKQREQERKRRLQKLTKQSILNKSYTEPEPKLQPSPPTPKTLSTSKVKVLDQVCMPLKHKSDSTSEGREKKMPRINSGSQFGSIDSNSKFGLNRSFGKPIDKDAKFPMVNEISMPKKTIERGEEPVKQGPLMPFGDFPQVKENVIPQKESQPQVPMIGEIKKATVVRPKRSFEQDGSTFFATPKKQEKVKAPSPPKPAQDDVFKMPRPYDASFDFMNSSYNAITDNQSQSSIEKSFDATHLPCFSPPPQMCENDKDGEAIFGENTNESPFGNVFLF